MAASDLYQFGNNLGLLYITKNDGTTFINTGTTNSANGVQTIKEHALTRSAVPYAIGAVGSYQFTVIGGADTIINLTINGIDQFDVLSPVAVVLGDLTGAASDLADAINAYTAASGANYSAYAIGGTCYFQAPPSYGSSVNGDVVLLVQTIGNITGTATNIAGGSDGGEVYSGINGARYWMYANAAAVVGNLGSAVEITEYVVKRGTEAQVPSQAQTIASSSVTGLTRYAAISVLDLGAGGAVNLDVITGEPALNDILILKNTSAFTITVRDQSLSSGNIILSPTSFAMVNDNYIISLMYINDPTDGLVWKEIWRVPLTVAANSITQTELALLSVGTPELIDLSVTAAKIAANTITQGEMAALSIGTPELIAASVTQAKLALLSVGTPQLILLSVDSTILAANSVITAKILDDNVTIPKMEDDANRFMFHCPLSFELATEVGQMKVELPVACTVEKISGSVIKLIEATDDATMIPKNNAGVVMTAGQIDFTAAAPIGNVFTSTPTGNNTFLANEIMIFETSKITYGGIAWCTVHAIKT